VQTTEQTTTFTVGLVLLRLRMDIYDVAPVVCVRANMDQPEASRHDETTLLKANSAPG
jgi:hypothetical protein